MAAALILLLHIRTVPVRYRYRYRYAGSHKMKQNSCHMRHNGFVLPLPHFEFVRHIIHVYRDSLKKSPRNGQNESLHHLSTWFGQPLLQIEDRSITIKQSNQQLLSSQTEWASIQSNDIIWKAITNRPISSLHRSKPHRQIWQLQ